MESTTYSQVCIISNGLVRGKGTTFFGGGGRWQGAPGVGRIPAARLLSPSRTLLSPALTPLRIPASKYGHMRRVTVILTADEYTQVRTKAGLVPLSAWFRSLALNGSTAHKDVPRMARNGAGAGGAGATEPVRGDTAICAHHKGRGQLCYKCDSKFGNPVIA